MWILTEANASTYFEKKNCLSYLFAADQMCFVLIFYCFASMNRITVNIALFPAKTHQKCLLLDLLFHIGNFFRFLPFWWQ